MIPINLVLSGLTFLAILLLVDNQDRFFRYLVIPVSCYFLVLQLKNLIGERWNWIKIQKIFRVGFVSFGILIGLYFGYMTIRTLSDERKVQITKERELEARSCNAAEIQRLEPEIKKINSSLTKEDSIESVLKKMKLLAQKGSLGFSEENIKHQLATFSVKPRCDSNFEYFIEIYFDESKKVKEFKTWALNPPVGYMYQRKKASEDQVSWERIFLEELSTSYSRFGGQLVPPDDLIGPSSLPELSDPCAPGISSKERLKRLGMFGKVRQTGPGDYEAGGRRVSIFQYDNSLIYCQ